MEHSAYDWAETLGAGSGGARQQNRQIQRQSGGSGVGYGNTIFDRAVEHLRLTVGYYYNSLVKYNGEVDNNIDYAELSARLKESALLLDQAAAERAIQERQRPASSEKVAQLIFFDNIDVNLSKELVMWLRNDMVVVLDESEFDPNRPVFLVVQSSTNRYVAEVRETERYNKGVVAMLKKYQNGVHFIWLSPKSGSTIFRSDGPMGFFTAFVPFKTKVVEHAFVLDTGSTEHSVELVKSLL